MWMQRFSLDSLAVRLKGLPEVRHEDRSEIQHAARM